MSSNPSDGPYQDIFEGLHLAVATGQIVLKKPGQPRLTANSLFHATLLRAGSWRDVWRLGLDQEMSSGLLHIACLPPPPSPGPIPEIGRAHV